MIDRDKTTVIYLHKFVVFVILFDLGIISGVFGRGVDKGKQVLVKLAGRWVCQPPVPLK